MSKEEHARFAAAHGRAPKDRNGASPIPDPLVTAAADGFVIRGALWRHAARGRSMRPVVVINPATSVRARYYFRFASYLFANDFDVIVYDYRGIGDSRPSTLRGFEASWIDWGCLDFDAVLRSAATTFPDQPIYVVGHSAGGFILGFASENQSIRRVLTVGAQYAYWRDYDRRSRLKMLLKWHVSMPLVTLPFGYFPGRWLGWLEDTPRGVVRDWAFGRKRFEETWRGRGAARHPPKDVLVQRFARMNAPTLALSVTDDPFGTISAVERLLSYFASSPRTHLRISPEQVAESGIGHFGFFHDRFASKLWPIAVEWLRFGHVSNEWPGRVVRRDPSVPVDQRHSVPSRGGLPLDRSL